MNWTDDFEAFLERNIGRETAKEELLSRFGWVEELHVRAGELLSVESLQAMEPQEVYSRIGELSVPQCPIRLTNLGRTNDAAGIVASLVKLLKTPGGFAEKYSAAKFPQAGVVTVTELLCVSKPMRFVIRNTAFSRAAAKVVPLYTKKALDELPYEEFLDTCRELARVMEKRFAASGLGEWAQQHRYLLLYAVLVDKK